MKICCNETDSREEVCLKTVGEILSTPGAPDFSDSKDFSICLQFVEVKYIEKEGGLGKFSV